MAAILMATGGPRFDRALETRSVSRYAIVFVQRGWFDGDGGDGLFLMLERTGGPWRIARRHRVYVI